MHNSKLEDELYCANLMIQGLLSILIEDVSPQFQFDAPRREVQILAVLYKKKGFVTKEQIYSALYDGVVERLNNPISDTVIESHMSKLRTRLKTFGVSIKSERYRGYLLDDDNRKRLKDLGILITKG